MKMTKSFTDMRGNEAKRQWRGGGQGPEKKKPHNRFNVSSFFNTTSWQSTAVLVPSVSVCLKIVLGITTTLYILNQNHLLPKPLSAVVSKTLFWPTLPITILKRIGRWTTVVDDTVLMGGAPFGFAGIPQLLHEQHGVSLLLISLVLFTGFLVLFCCACHILTSISHRFHK